MKQMVSLPRTMKCDNCTGRTRLEYDRLDVGLGGGSLMHLSSVPYFQCQECDHRQMNQQLKDRMDQGIARFMEEARSDRQELFARLAWTEMLALDMGEESERLFEVEWILEDW